MVSFILGKVGKRSLFIPFIIFFIRIYSTEVVKTTLKPLQLSSLFWRLQVTTTSSCSNLLLQPPTLRQAAKILSTPRGGQKPEPFHNFKVILMVKTEPELDKRNFMLQFQHALLGISNTAINGLLNQLKAKIVNILCTHKNLI